MAGSEPGGPGGSQGRKCLPGRGKGVCRGSLGDRSGQHPLGTGEATGFKQGRGHAALSRRM